MSDKYICSGDKLTNIGDAIRAKTGSSNKLTLDDMANTIETIETDKGKVFTSINTGNGTTTLITGIDYIDNLNCVLSVAPLSKTTEYDYYTGISSDMRFIHSAVISQNYNYLNMCYITSNKKISAYIDHYDNQLSLSNNNGKVQINSENYVFSSSFNYIFIMWNGDIVNIEEINSSDGYIYSNTEYKANSNFAVLSFGDYNSSTINTVSIIGTNISTRSTISTKYQVYYYGNIYSYWSFISDIPFTDIYHFSIVNNNGNIKIEKLYNTEQIQAPIDANINYLLLTW